MQEYIHHTLRTVTASPSTVVKNTSVSSCRSRLSNLHLQHLFLGCQSRIEAAGNTMFIRVAASWEKIASVTRKFLPLQRAATREWINRHSITHITIIIWKEVSALNGGFAGMKGLKANILPNCSDCRWKLKDKQNKQQNPPRWWCTHFHHGIMWCFSFD